MKSFSLEVWRKKENTHKHPKYFAFYLNPVWASVGTHIRCKYAQITIAWNFVRRKHVSVVWGMVTLLEILNEYQCESNASGFVVIICWFFIPFLYHTLFGCVRNESWLSGWMPKSDWMKSMGCFHNIYPGELAGCEIVRESGGLVVRAKSGGTRLRFAFSWGNGIFCIQTHASNAVCASGRCTADVR